MAQTFASAHHAPHHHPAPHPVKKPVPPKKHGHGGLIAGAIIGLGAGMAALYFAFAPGIGRPDPTEVLLEQMTAAATGQVVPTHAYGGTLSVVFGNGPANVTADKLPAKACVQVGWRLAKEGTIIVNGILPQRLSAAKLSELCSSEGGATLTWVPDQE